MTSGTGLTEFAAKYPERFFDVGIAEGHGTAMAAGMASQGIVPVFAVYSTFLQRAYDMLLHDVAIMNLHAVFAVDRAGLVGADGETHQGIFDVGYLSTVPNMKILCPASFEELREMLRHAILSLDGPVAIRYPKSSEGRYKEGCLSEGIFQPSKLLREGKDITIVTYGVSVNTALDAADSLLRYGISVEIVKLNLINPIDFDAIDASVHQTGHLLVLEECVEQGSAGERIAAHCALHSITLKSLRLLNIGSRFIPQGSINELRKMCGLDVESLVREVTGLFGNPSIIEVSADTDEGAVDEADENDAAENDAEAIGDETEMVCPDDDEDLDYE
jgi:1-deoxy-D-xylulose-5-phosphate synthase